jgi:hypothetical protein
VNNSFALSNAPSMIVFTSANTRSGHEAGGRQRLDQFGADNVSLGAADERVV